MPFPFVALFAVIKAACVVCGAVFCTHKVTEAYKKNQKLKGLKYKDREAARQAALEANKQVDAEKNNYEDKAKTNENKIQDLEKKAEAETRKSKDPNLTEEERAVSRRKVREYMDEIDRLKQENKDFYNKVKDLDKQKKDNDKVISSASSGAIYDSDRGWI
ncbi:6830_t:CDS:1 [Funneliformis geosporum]|nr:6830_t:CDS:1 [Funneliformis geosporum]